MCIATSAFSPLETTFLIFHFSSKYCFCAGWGLSSHLWYVPLTHTNMMILMIPWRHDHLFPAYNTGRVVKDSYLSTPHWRTSYKEVNWGHKPAIYLQALTCRFNFNRTYDILLILHSVPLSSLTWTEIPMNKPHCYKLACLVVACPLFWKLFACPLSLTPGSVFFHHLCSLWVDKIPSTIFTFSDCLLIYSCHLFVRSYYKEKIAGITTLHNRHLRKVLKSLVHVPACDTVTSSPQLKPKVTNNSQMMRFTTSGAFPVSNPRRLEQGKAVESWCLQSFPEAIQRDASASTNSLILPAFLGSSSGVLCSMFSGI